jgi:guanylate kinase
MSMSKGLLIVLSGPSGVGKGTLCKALRNQTTSIQYSVSATTRAPREGEIDGVHYFFKTREQFESMIANNALLEWAEYVGNYYGTPAQYVRDNLENGKDVILEIEVQGAQKVRELFPEGIFIFLLPPSLEELRSRIVGRGTESEETINQRMQAASDELALLSNYDYAVVNDDLESARAKVEAILSAEHCRRDRMQELVQSWT